MLKKVKSIEDIPAVEHIQVWYSRSWRCWMAAVFDENRNQTTQAETGHEIGVYRWIPRADRLDVYHVPVSI